MSIITLKYVLFDKIFEQWVPLLQKTNAHTLTKAPKCALDLWLLHKRLNESSWQPQSHLIWAIDLSPSPQVFAIINLKNGLFRFTWSVSQSKGNFGRKSTWCLNSWLTQVEENFELTYRDLLFYLAWFSKVCSDYLYLLLVFCDTSKMFSMTIFFD